MFKSRSIWLRNIGLGVPISAADFIYAVEETGKSSYLFVLAYLSALVGDAPYGMHVFNTTLYLAGGFVIYRLVRPSYGRLVALGGLTVLLFLPSLFFWSISALKEPLYTLLAAVELWCALTLSRRSLGEAMVLAGRGGCRRHRPGRASRGAAKGRHAGGRAWDGWRACPRIDTAPAAVGCRRAARAARHGDSDAARARDSRSRAVGGS